MKRHAASLAENLTIPGACLQNGHPGTPQFPRSQVGMTIQRLRVSLEKVNAL